MSKGSMFNTLKDTLVSNLKGSGKRTTEINTEVLKLSLKWYNANPSSSFPWGHLETKYMALPGRYSTAQREVLEEFNLLEDHPKPF